MPGRLESGFEMSAITCDDWSTAGKSCASMTNFVVPETYLLPGLSFEIALAKYNDRKISNKISSLFTRKEKPGKRNPFCNYTKNFKIDENTKPFVRMGRKTQGSLCRQPGCRNITFPASGCLFFTAARKVGPGSD